MDSLPQTIKVLARRVSRHGHLIRSLHAVSRMHQALGELAIVGHHDQALA
jgi:hypothetical protein